MKKINVSQLMDYLCLLAERLSLRGSDVINLVVCGGSALIATNLVNRTTKDVDVVARISDSFELVDPEPLPIALIEEVKVVAQNYGLPEDWINCGPSDLFRMGLPLGFKERLSKVVIGECLIVYFISRLDQVYFKLYAAVDRGGYHIDDLLTLNPTNEELIDAARWSMTHDVSEGYKMMLKQLLKALGFDDVINSI